MSYPFFKAFNKMYTVIYLLVLYCFTFIYLFSTVGLHLVLGSNIVELSHNLYLYHILQPIHIPVLSGLWLFRFLERCLHLCIGMAQLKLLGAKYSTKNSSDCKTEWTCTFTLSVTFFYKNVNWIAFALAFSIFP